MFEQILNFISSEKLLDENDRLLLAVSGGVDSMVLAHLFHSSKYEIHVAHMNFQLRGEDSNNDEKFIREWCKSRGVPFFLKRVELSKQGKSTQMEARDLRYDWFQELLKEQELSKILTAHHLDDSLETVLLNLTKGTGINGLTGIAPLSRLHIVRPLLNFQKSELLQYAEDEGIAWREDRSNKSVDYQRNQLRNIIVPELLKINYSLQKTFRNTQKRLRGTQQLMQRVVREVSESIDWEAEPLVIPLSWRQYDLSDGVVLYELLSRFGVSSTEVEDILSAKESGKVFLIKKHLINYDRGRLIIRALNECEDILTPVVINEPGLYDYNNIRIKVSLTCDKSISKKQNDIKLDASLVEFPIVVRPWKTGDRFSPLGMSGKKMISDFMIDLKIPITLKKDIPIFESHKEILWVGGHRIDERFKITDKTTECLRIEIQEYE